MTIGAAVRPVTLSPSALIALHALHPQRYPALFESAAASEPTGRFDILFAFPGAKLTLDSRGALTVDPEIGIDTDGTFLQALDGWWKLERLPHAAGRWPFTGGWLVYLGYELAGQIEPRLQLPVSSVGPVAQAIRVPVAVLLEHATGSAWIVAEPGAEALIDAVLSDLARLDAADTDSATADVSAAQPGAGPGAAVDAGLSTVEPGSAPGALLRTEVVEDPPSDYLDAVERALEYIAAGDVYQANLSRGYRAQLNQGVQPHHVYQRLRQTNPGPFCALALFDDLAIVSSSPERLISVSDRWAATRPIAGTRPRGRDENTDAQLVRELRDHPKELAEHVMLIDLERNDLGRVCEAGTVQVDEYMTIESYAHVHHIVSNVRGRLRPEVTPGQALAAVFPGGTITGCPKVRCMEIIAELERTPRGVYTGSLGYLNRDGSMDFNILIRSLAISGATVSLRTGAGIVADSIPERELEEARAKARGVLHALSEQAP